MKLQLNIRQKISFFVLGASILLFSITIGFSSISSKRMAYDNITKLTDSYTDHYAAMVESWLNSDIAIARSLSNAFLEHKQIPFDQWRHLIMGMYQRVLEANPQVDAIWDSWEYSYLDPNWEKEHGRWLHISYRENGRILSKTEARSLDKDPPVYASLKSASRESVVEPYLSTLQVGGFMTSLTSPMFVNGKYIGLIGIDVFLGRFQALVCGIKPYPESHAFLLSNKGTFIAHPDTAIFSKNIIDVYPELNEEQQVLDKIRHAERYNFTYTDKVSGKKLFYSISPISIGHTNTPWALGIVVPEDVILADANKNFNISLIVGIVSVLVLVLIILILANNITKPIKQITLLLEELALGRVDGSMQVSINTGDEIAQMGRALSKSIKGLIAKTEFATNIGKGELNTELKRLSDYDSLGKSLIEMQKSLQKAKEEEEERKKEEEVRRWINEGLAKFGDILRQNNDNLSRLSDEITKNLVWYLNASLGGLFVKDQDSETLELVSAFAYDRKRFLKKSFEPGEGLIGACAAEKDTIFLAVVPDEYIEVDSGLGGTKPNSILLIPLKIEGEILGVIELASLKQFSKNEIEFVEKLAESIASTLKSVRINQTTADLLQKSQEQAEMMAAQEEEMRQNMEELQATQEEAARKSVEMESIINALNASSFVMEYDTDGTIISINEAYLKLLGLTREEAIGKHHSDNIVLSDAQKMVYEEFWANLRKGKIQKQTTHVNMHGREFTFLETYTPIQNSNGEVYKILKIATDISSNTAH